MLLQHLSLPETNIQLQHILSILVPVVLTQIICRRRFEIDMNTRLCSRRLVTVVAFSVVLLPLAIFNCNIINRYLHAEYGDNLVGLFGVAVDSQTNTYLDDNDIEEQQLEGEEQKEEDTKYDETQMETETPPKSEEKPFPIQMTTSLETQPPSHSPSSFLSHSPSHSPSLPLLRSLPAFPASSSHNIASDIFLGAFPNSTTLRDITSFEELQLHIHHPDDFPTIPNNLNIVFVGDSLMRYQYLQLAYFLSHNGTWFPDTTTPHFTNEHQYKGWTHFFNSTVSQLAPYEQCDCYRPDGKVWLENRQNRLFENRYFYEPNHNNTLIYLQKMGNNTMKFSWNVSNVQMDVYHGPLITEENDVNTIYAGQWVDTIQNYICHLTPKPHVFLFNQGHWDNHLLVNITIQNEIVSALKECNIISIFKTKTKLNIETNTQMEDWEVALCEKTDYCQDLGWTGLVEKKDYIDRYHFTPRIYRWTNLQTLALLSSIAREKPSSSLSSPMDRIQIFYNLFIKDASDFNRVETFVQEQLSFMIPGVHNDHVIINAIGYNTTTIAKQSISQHYTSGGEDLTLFKLWEYCTDNPHHDAKVIYLHSKGSFHARPENEQLRKFLTEGALSLECSNLPDQCTICSSRMSPLPHPHTSGNMWLARCDYIAKLINPSTARKWFKKTRDIPCKGLGRYFYEHWVHGHPSVQPCDLYTGKEYVWEYSKIPATGFEKKLELAPRFEYKDYVIPGKCKDETTNPEDSLNERLHEYSFLYQQNPENSWWGWKLYQKPLTEFEKDVRLLVKSHLDVSIIESNKTALEVRKNQSNVTIVMAFCDKPIDWIKGYIGQEYKVTELIIYSKCEKDVGGLDDLQSFFNITPQVILLPNVGRCDHTYAYHIRKHYQSIVANEAEVKDNIVMFLKDHAYHIKFYRPIDELYKMTAQLGFGCVMFFRPCYKPCLRRECKRFEFSMMHNRTNLNKFSLSGWNHFDRDSQEAFHNNSFATLKSFEDAIGFAIPKSSQLLPVCYGGSFAVKKRNILKQSEEVWTKVEEVLSRANNIVEGHYMERLWEAAILGQSNEYAAAVDEFIGSNLDHTNNDCGLDGITAISRTKKAEWIQFLDF